jgi:hypothetical protein
MKRKIIFNENWDTADFDNVVVGVTHQNHMEDWFFDEVHNDSIDLMYEEFRKEIIEEAIAKAKEDLLDGVDTVEIDIEEYLQDYQPDGHRNLIGDWMQLNDGQYVPNKAGKNGFAATYSDFCGGTICVEWSKWYMKCNRTSPCFVMKDGRPCGDLDTTGSEAMLAYCLPEEWFRGEEE